ncbi:hypothetical protein EV121DRAFT_297971, partial [Schizophyllum commune]
MLKYQGPRGAGLPPPVTNIGFREPGWFSDTFASALPQLVIIRVAVGWPHDQDRHILHAQTLAHERLHATTQDFSLYLPYDRRPAYSPERFDRRYAGEGRAVKDRGQDRGRYVAKDRFEDRAQYASGSRYYPGEERRYAGGDRRYASGDERMGDGRHANGDEGSRHRDFIKEAWCGRSAQAYPSPEPRYGDPRSGAYDSISESRQRYPASVSDARYSTPSRALTAQATYLPGPNARDASREGLDYRHAPVDGQYPALYPPAPTSQRSLTADAPSPSSRMLTSPVRVIVACPVSEDADGEAEEEDELMADEPTQPDEDHPAWIGNGSSDAMDVDGPRVSNARNNALSARLSPHRSSPARRTSPARPPPLPEDDVDADIAAAIDGSSNSRSAPSMSARSAPSVRSAPSTSARFAPSNSARSVHDDDVDADIAAAVDDPSDDVPRSRHVSEARSRHDGEPRTRHDNVDADIAAAVDADADTAAAESRSRHDADVDADIAAAVDVDADIAAAVDADLHDAADAARVAVGSRSGSRVAFSDTVSHSLVDADGEVEEAGRGPYEAGGGSQ